MSTPAFIPGISRASKPELVMPVSYLCGEAGGGKTRVAISAIREAIKTGAVKPEEVILIANDVWGTAFRSPSDSLGADALVVEQEVPKGVEVKRQDEGCSCCEDTNGLANDVKSAIESRKKMVVIEGAPGGDPTAPITALDGIFNLRTTVASIYNANSVHPDPQFFTQTALAADISITTRGSHYQHLDVKSRILELRGEGGAQLDFLHSPRVGEFAGDRSFFTTAQKQRTESRQLGPSKGHIQSLYRCNLSIPDELALLANGSRGDASEVRIVNTRTREEFSLTDALKSLPRAKALMYDETRHPYEIDYVKDTTGPRVTITPLDKEWSVSRGEQVVTLMNYEREFAARETVKLGTPTLELALYSHPAYQYPDPAAVLKKSGFIPTSHRADSLYLTASLFVDGYPSQEGNFSQKFSTIVERYGGFRTKALAAALSASELSPELKERVVLEVTFDLMKLLISHGAPASDKAWHLHLLHTPKFAPLHNTIITKRENGGLDVPGLFFRSLAHAEKLPLPFLNLPYEKLSPTAKDFSPQDPGMSFIGQSMMVARAYGTPNDVIRAGLNGLKGAMQREGREDFLRNWQKLDNFAHSLLKEVR